MFKYENVSVEWADNTVRFDYIDWSDSRVPNEIAEHWHAELEINYTITGSIRDYVVEDETFQTAPGDFVVINPFQVHGVHDIMPGTQSLLLLISRPFMDKFAPRLGQVQFGLMPGQDLTSQQHKTRAKLALLMQEVYETSQSKDQFSDDLMTGLILQILAVLASQFSVEAPHRVNDNVARTVAYIQRNYMEDLTLEHLAHRVHLSVAYFDRSFKKQMGMSVMQYVNKIRALHANQLLTVHQKTVAFTALEVGYPSTQALNRGLRKHFGMTASELKKAKNDLKMVN